MKKLNPLQKEINLRQAVLLGKDISDADISATLTYKKPI
jgi:hypothetical protein